MRYTEKKIQDGIFVLQYRNKKLIYATKNRGISQKIRFLLYKSGKSKLAYVLQYILVSKATGNRELKNTYEKRKEKEK